MHYVFLAEGEFIYQLTRYVLGRVSRGCISRNVVKMPSQGVCCGDATGYFACRYKFTEVYQW